ncbi:hypothetical protein TWF225_000097 [Orbilia oligospora]|uniref:Uncharacterized protein n=1 Tax=Orbilia oligospora TaxID=2813651 RepID=A0A7C8PC69_ORBOL|nr:hypothetical protein TWF751_008135 [Orbilia oligospora]KAF3195704.1 hypothetical protein TWF225_000097 [Orbilia oligospora]KAF3256073.1 hypothetical protein TWF128_005509 [Orbilia oligospora]KAF3261415.1 hypothetical protein TWF217_004556 [Orbilia oligospora]KAF3294247.1 hypothetical protein TWF132_003675 [Orbilia oligospora]
MSTSFGFKAKPGLSKPGKPLSKPSAFSKPSVFGGLADDDDSDDGDPTKSLNKPVQYGLQKPVSSSSSAPSKRSGPGSLNKPSLSKPAPPHEEEEEEKKEDPSIYDYDTAWDSMKAAEDRRKTATQGSSQDRKPKYMENLLASAKVRERDRLRAKDRMLQKEREAEGEEFADKDKFVTGAYKAQQEEIRRLEEEEKRKQEEMERKGGGIAGFYRNMLDDTEKHHAELVKATEKKNDEPSFLMSRPGEEQDMKDKAKSEAEIAAELNKKAAGSVDVNDEGQVVDKRQLLGAGLNVKPKPKPTSSKSQGDSRSRDSRDSYSRPMNDDYRANKAKREMRERQSRMIAQQLEEASRKTARDEAADRAEIERQAKMRKTTTGDVNSARERYLQRKKEAEEKKKAGA